MKSTIIPGFRITLAVAAATLGAASLLSCGGGGGGGGGGSGGSPEIQYLTITSDNAFNVSAAVLQGIVLGFDTSEVGAGPVEPASAAAAGGLGTRGSKPGPAALLADTRAGGTLAPAIAIGPTTEPCDGGGTVTISGNLANPGTLTTGDTITLQFNDCDDNDGTVLDGRLGLVLRNVLGDLNTDVFQVTADADFTALTITDGTDTYQADGDVTVTLDSLDFPVFSQVISGASFQISASADSYTLIDFTQTLTVDTGVIPDTKLAVASGTLASEALDGKVDYETTVPIEATGDLDPHAGEILVTGADDTTVTIVIEDGSSVRLDIDTNGDGVVDDQQFTTWSELTGNTSSITAANAEAVTAEVLIAAAQFGSQVSAVGGLFSATQPFGNVASQGVSGSFGPVQTTCPTAGTADVSGFVAAAGNYSAGDELVASLNICVSPQRTLDGQLLINVTDFQGQANSNYRYTGDAVLAWQLSMSGDSDLTASGTLSSSYDNAFSAAQMIEVAGSSDGLALTSNGVTRLLSAVNAAAQIDVSSTPFVVSSTPSGRLTSDLVGGPYQYQNVSPLVSVIDPDPATGPFSGEFVVTGTDGTSVRLVALNNLDVRLDLDLDGDQAVDQQIFTTWAALFGAVP